MAEGSNMVSYRWFFVWQHSLTGFRLRVALWRLSTFSRPRGRRVVHPFGMLPAVCVCLLFLGGLEALTLVSLFAEASNAGGVAVSGLEMAQNSQRLAWSSEEVDAKLKAIMTECFGVRSGHHTCFLPCLTPTRSS